MRDVFGHGPWLVVVPHDDDLVLGLGLTVAAATREGIEVHVAIATDGSLGYTVPEDRLSLVETRAAELEDASVLLGIQLDFVHRFDLPDGSLMSMQGCRPLGEPPSLAQLLVSVMRTVRPSHVFVCTPTDVHPDHRAAAAETEIASFWASAPIWLELGEPIVEPQRWHYAVYCPFDGAPDLEVQVDTPALEQKLAALACFASQGVIAPMVERLRADGPFEYLRRATSQPYRPRNYRHAFARAAEVTSYGQRYREDCRLVLDVIDRFPVRGAEQLERALSHSEKPLLLIAEGSSQLFPTRFAEWLAMRGGFGGRVLSAGGREAKELRLDGYKACLISNSGATRELVELVRAARDPLVVVGQADGPLAQATREPIVVLPRPEQVVPATASVFAQALYLGQAVLRVAGYKLELLRLREAVAWALSVDVSAALGKNAGAIERVVWSDPGHGAGAELSLKTMEVAGIPSMYAKGNLLLHGVEEALGEHDLIVWLDPGTDDRALRAAIAESTGAMSISIGGEESVWPMPNTGPLSPLVELMLGFRIVETLAIARGRDPDRTQRARKVGNPFKNE
jgi:LmbE family N-acetylglucosaminyl deacetylase/fructoselysine-6-P-deglycase FrlB-like protein